MDLSKFGDDSREDEKEVGSLYKLEDIVKQQQIEPLDVLDARFKRYIQTGNAEGVEEMVFADTDRRLRDYEYDGFFSWIPAPYYLLSFERKLWTPLQWACIYDSTGIITNLLLKYQCPYNCSRTKVYPLHLAAVFDNVNCAKLLLKYRVDPNLLDRYGNKAIQYAVSEAMRQVFALGDEKEDDEDSFQMVLNFETSMVPDDMNDEVERAEMFKGIPQEVREGLASVSRRMASSRSSQCQSRESADYSGEEEIEPEEVPVFSACATPSKNMANFFGAKTVINFLASGNEHGPSHVHGSAFNEEPTVIRTAEQQKADLERYNSATPLDEVKSKLRVTRFSAYSEAEDDFESSIFGFLRKKSLSSRNPSTTDASNTVDPTKLLEFSFIEPDFITLDKDKPLGSGAFGVVFRGKWRQTSDVAVKVVQSNQRRNLQIDDPKLISEVKHLSQLKHPCLVKFYGASICDGALWLVMEFASCGSLYHFLHISKKKYSISSVAKWALSIAEGMNYLHRRALIHRDLKSPNVLLTPSRQFDDILDPWETEPTGLSVKICDFGLSCKEGMKTLGVCGSYQWMAPETFVNKTCQKSDVYSYAIILWEMLTRCIPYEALEGQQIMWQVGRNKLRPPIHSNFPAVARKLITTCWDSEIENRLTFDGIIVYLIHWDITCLEPDEQTAMPEVSEGMPRVMKQTGKYNDKEEGNTEKLKSMEIYDRYPLKTAFNRWRKQGNDDSDGDGEDDGKDVVEYEDNGWSIIDIVDREENMTATILEDDPDDESMQTITQNDHKSTERCSTPHLLIGENDDKKNYNNGANNDDSDDDNNNDDFFISCDSVNQLDVLQRKWQGKSDDDDKEEEIISITMDRTTDPPTGPCCKEVEEVGEKEEMEDDVDVDDVGYYIPQDDDFEEDDFEEDDYQEEENIVSEFDFGEG
eukprot:m.40233 g.40233  ORF g.40233 m.40233 type:complete len:923 (+) comp6912_c0_seq3:222-2990(+)